MPSSACGVSPKHNNDLNARGGSNNAVSSGNTNQINVTQAKGEDVGLDRSLGGYRNVSEDVVHSSSHSPPECHPNTRTTVRNEIRQWTDESVSEKSPLLWVYGPPGAGKSVIVKTIAASHDHIVALFDFSTSPDRSATTLVATLARQLAQKIPETKPHITTSLKNNGSLMMSIEEQFDHLIIQSLKKCRTRLRSRPVMVIDGIEDCVDENILARFLRMLVRAGEGGSIIPVRFIICSRPELRIRAILGRAHHVDPTANGRERLPSLRSARNLMRFIRPTNYEANLRTPRQPSQGFTRSLQDVWELYRPIWLGVDKHALSPSDTCHELADVLDRICHHPVISTIQIGFSEECNQDIARYLTDTFNAIPRSGDGTIPWFTTSDISDLVRASRGQFLYASVIVKLLAEPHSDPRDVFEMARRHGGSLPTLDLNELYKAILKRAQDTIRNEPHRGGPDYETELGFLMDSLAILVFLAGNVYFFTVPKSFLVMESLLGLESGQLTKKLAGSAPENITYPIQLHCDGF
ncbi:hypothetical protein M378DRAFT_916548 [Amanita muscaria Koide BX008]|uniref:Nephrocystin 3-like N-terminal domain-containing protein n=1 Tax=Amanita muscaria (strain Koide BX008) TaxID=946122 RepID=A0A0C2WUT9_AMAMK|nr:hypothetical protein M378DRAFT_916548 [Amanita muscaria Koide BX008]